MNRMQLRVASVKWCTRAMQCQFSILVARSVLLNATKDPVLTYAVQTGLDNIHSRDSLGPNL